MKYHGTNWYGGVPPFFFIQFHEVPKMGYTPLPLSTDTPPWLKAVLSTESPCIFF